MSSAGAFPAKTSPSQDEEPASTASAADSSMSTSASFARFDPASSSWKTSQPSLLGDLDVFSGSWPRSGTTESGTAFRRRPSAPLTKGTGSSSLPTPTATMAQTKGDLIGHLRGTKGSRMLPTPSATTYGHNKGGGAGREGQPERASLETLARRGMLPTPTCNTSTWHNSHGTRVETLHGLAAMGRLPTPTAQDAKNNTLPPSQHDRDSLPGTLLRAGERGGSLHPRFVEWMMGFPLGWTDLDDDDQ